MIVKASNVTRARQMHDMKTVNLTLCSQYETHTTGELVLSMDINVHTSITLRIAKMF